MKIVIDIPNKVYSYIIQECTVLDDGYDSPINHIVHSILHGVILPKGHGRLIDADAYRKEMMNSQEFNFFKTLDMQPTIIEADKEQ